MESSDITDDERSDPGDEDWTESGTEDYSDEDGVDDDDSTCVEDDYSEYSTDSNDQELSSDIDDAVGKHCVVEHSSNKNKQEILRQNVIILGSKPNEEISTFFKYLFNNERCIKSGKELDAPDRTFYNIKSKVNLPKNECIEAEIQTENNSPFTLHDIDSNSNIGKEKPLEKHCTLDTNKDEPIDTNTVCLHCEKIFEDKQMLIDHLITVTREKQLQEQEKEFINNESKDKDYINHLEIQEIQIENNSSLALHDINFNSKIDKEEDDLEKHYNLDINQDEPIDTNTVCLHCEKIFEDKQMLIDHLIAVTREKQLEEPEQEFINDESKEANNINLLEIQDPDANAKESMNRSKKITILFEDDVVNDASSFSSITSDRYSEAQQYKKGLKNKKPKRQTDDCAALELAVCCVKPSKRLKVE